MTFILMTLSELYGREVGIHQDTNQLCFIDEVDDEIAYMPIEIDRGQTSFGLKADFFMLNNQTFEPSINRQYTENEREMNHVGTVHLPSEIEKYTVQDFIENGADGKRIAFNSKRKVNCIAHTINDKRLRAECDKFENLILDKLVQGISEKSKRNTHQLFLDYEKLVKGNEPNKLLVLSEMSNILSDSIAKSRTEKIRTNSRYNEDVKVKIKESAKKDVWKEFKIRLFTVVFVIAGIAGLYLYFNPDSVLPTLSDAKIETFSASEVAIMDKMDKEREAKIASRKTWSNKEINALITIYADKQGKKVWEFRRGKIAEEFSGKKFTDWEAKNVIEKEIKKLK